MGDLSLIDGWVPPVLLAVGGVALFLLLARGGRGGLVTVVVAVLLAALTYVGLNPLVVDVLDLVPEPLPSAVLVWIAVGLGAVALAVGSLFGTTAARKALAIVCGVLVLVTAGSQVNVYFEEYPTVASLAGDDGDPLSTNDRGVQSRSMDTPVVDRWEGPATGASSVPSAPIPGTVSGFTGRPARIYLPAAYHSPDPPLLPVLILVAGQPGGPDDWVVSGRLQMLMDG
ncbi:MAG: hypothetical protein L0H84_20510, partial [Pseudonocardia sp.]|nr:hypothetical protein [Pseudonocardia sp.]